MAAVDITASGVRPLNGAVIRRYLAASTNVAAGKAVYVKNDGTIEVADKDDVAQAQARGVVIAIGTNGKTTAAVGDQCDVVVSGPVALANVTAMTEGAVVYVGDSGAVDQTASATSGDFNYIIGYAEAGTILFVQGAMAIPVAV